MSLKIKENNYGLRVYCTKCKKQFNYHNDICDHIGYQHYKSIVSDGSKRRVKMYDTNNYDDALRSAIQFKSDVKNGVLDNNWRDKIDPENISVIDAANIFIAYRSNINVPKHKQRNISKNHFNDIKRNIQQFIDTLKDNNVNVANTRIDSIDDFHVGYWYEYITDNYAKASLRNKLNNLKEFINHMISKHKVKMVNPFNDVILDSVNYDTTSITEEEFNKLLEAVETKSPYQRLKGKRNERKNHYRPYLIDGFKLALFTGLRREELVNLHWNDLYYSDKLNCLAFRVINLKVERITGEEYKKKIVPVAPQLHELLLELGYDDFNGSDMPVLFPNRDCKAKTMMENLSRGFNHFYKQAFPDAKPKKFKVLRKTYLSYLNKEVGDNMIELSSHGSMKTLNKHYIDAEVVTKGVNMRIFS